MTILKTTVEQRAALAALADKATGTPWCKDDHECKPGDLGEGRYGIFELGEDDPALAYVGPWGEPEENTSLIIAAVNALPALIADISTLQAEVERLDDKAVRLADALPDLSDVIIWLENGCSPKAAVTELRIHEARISRARQALGGDHE